MVCFSKQLKSGLNYWETIAPVTVVNWIKDGIQIPFQEKRPDHFVLPNKVSSKYADFVSNEIEDLLHKDVIEQVYEVPLCTSPINVVPKKNGKYRLITDLRELNAFCKPPKFTNQGLNEVLELIRPNDYLVTVDIKNGFHHIPVHPLDRTFLGFQWNSAYYQWKCLPFGLNGSPFFFYKVIRAVVQHLRQRGLRVVAFVDDFLLISTAESAENDKQIVLDTLCELGFVINYEKSSLVPCTTKEYIGYVFSTANNDDQVWIRIPQARIRKLRHDIRRALNSKCITARALARIAGQCVSMCKVILPSKLLLRNLYRLLQCRTSWQDRLTLDQGTMSDLEWWQAALKSWNGRAVTGRTVEAQLTTDASGTGWGAHMNGLHAAGFWNLRMSTEHSNYRELMAVMMAIISFSDHLRGKHVQLLSDNITTVAYLNHLGGPNLKLSKLTTAIWAECYHKGIHLHAKYLAGSSNTLADWLSRISLKYDWMLHPKLFLHIDRLFGPHDIDRFASLTTTQLPRYNSLYFDPLSTGIDALSQKDWHGLNNYVNAPFHLIPRVLDVIQCQRAEATLIAPYWPAQSWIKRLCQMAVAPPMRLPVSRRSGTQNGEYMSGGSLEN